MCFSCFFACFAFSSGDIALLRLELRHLRKIHSIRVTFLQLVARLPSFAISNAKKRLRIWKWKLSWVSQLNILTKMRRSRATFCAEVVETPHRVRFPGSIWLLNEIEMRWSFSWIACSQHRFVLWTYLIRERWGLQLSRSTKTSRCSGCVFPSSPRVQQLPCVAPIKKHIKEKI